MLFVPLLMTDGMSPGHRGSHIILVKEGSIVTLSVPDHREVAKGTLRSLIRSSGLTVEEFIQLTRRCSQER
jgi:predicted RNA binding protein YcfA (HicA-like mRNA interferase family)